MKMLKLADSNPPSCLAAKSLALFTAVAITSLLPSACKRAGTSDSGAARGPGGGRSADALPVPIVPGVVERKDVPIYLDGLGTVQAFNSVLVRSRIDGQVEHIAFTEGQDVRSGEVLAQIDPRPLQAQLDQASAKKGQDEAQLAVAKVNLARDSALLGAKILPQQEFDAQQALVEQLQATVKADQAAIDNAKTQLGYSTIRSPLDGRTGIRMVDQGNIVHANDANGLVVIVQLRPISVLFTLPEQDLRQIQEHLMAGEKLDTFAMDRENRTVLGEGALAVVDNQIDTTTGTIRLKATFPNEQLKLWPGEFVNVRLLVAVRKGGAVVPASVVQRGPDGAFAYVISNEVAVIRPVKVAQIDQGQALVDEGLEPGERVVVDGQYKLQPGARVQLPGVTRAVSPTPAGRPAAGKKAS